MSSSFQIPVKLRATNYGNLVQGLLFIITFNTAIILISIFQIILFPISFFSLNLYRFLITITKSSFSKATIWISQLYAPTNFIITAGKGVNKDWILRDYTGKCIGVKFPNRAIWVR